MAQTWPKGHLSQWRQLIDQCRNDDRFDTRLEPEILTDKELVKIGACQYCKRPLVVTTFYVDAWMKCSPCKGVTTERAPGTVEVAQQGRTEPRLAADLVKVLINPHFATALCPTHPDDPDHEMELKSVNWSERYGPHEYRVVDGRLTPVQVEQGETVLHQCLKCKATVVYSTTAVTQFSRINEVGRGKNVNQNAVMLGSRDDTLDHWDRKVNDFVDPAEVRLEEGWDVA